jgi:hypothetical protein
MSYEEQKLAVEV